MKSGIWKSSISNILIGTAALTLFAALTASALIAQDQQKTENQAPYYFLRLRSLGGTANIPNSINDLGWITGGDDLKGNATEHATLWLYGSLHDLGTLGGPNSAVLWPVHNETGVIAGVSDTSVTDPLGETWSCGAFLPASHTGHTCLGFLSQNGVMEALPTLGGNNGFATGVNNHGLAVGWAETELHDRTCSTPQVLQFEAVVYGPNQGEIQILDPLSGDPDSAATAINDNGQIVGISGKCGFAVGGLSAKHAVLWQNGTVTQLGTLGGSANNTPMIINTLGQIAGFSDLPGDEDGANPNFHAAYWAQTSGTPADLGTLPGDFFSEATGLNDRGQMVGESCNSSFTLCTALLWENGDMIDLNSIIPHGNLYLFFANDINASGEITGVALNQDTGELVGYLAIPTSGAVQGLPADTQARATRVSRIPIPEDLRQQFVRRLGLGSLLGGK
jgi:probable HAF family extracellular repeat protein